MADPKEGFLCQGLAFQTCNNLAQCLLHCSKQTERDDFSNSCPITLPFQILSLKWEGESIEIFMQGVLAICWVEFLG